MITVSHRTNAAPADVWAIIADGWSYAAWIVGTSRIRAVEGNWPEAGSKIHHSVGAWPLLLSDETVSQHSEPGRLVKLQAKGGPVGEASVEIVLTADGTGTLIEMREDATEGPARILPHPLRQALIKPRNQETLTRLALLAEARQAPSV